LRDFIVSGKTASASQGVYADRIRIIWRPISVKVGDESNKSNACEIWRVDDDEIIQSRWDSRIENDATSWDDSDKQLVPRKHYTYVVFPYYFEPQKIVGPLPPPPPGVTKMLPPGTCHGLLSRESIEVIEYNPPKLKWKKKD